MSLKDAYTAFLRERLQSRIDGLRTAFTPLFIEPPSINCSIEIALFPENGLTGEPPILLHAFRQNGMQMWDVDCVVRSNDLLKAMLPLITMEEAERFYVWEGEGQDRVIALEQPIDGVDEVLLREWIRKAWQGLNMREYQCQTSIVVHDGDAEPLRV